MMVMDKNETLKRSGGEDENSERLIIITFHEFFKRETPVLFYSVSCKTAYTQWNHARRRDGEEKRSTHDEIKSEIK